MWEKLRPETVANYVRFDRTDEKWSYDPVRDDMYTKQAEGVAFLWNRLSDYDIALLADEVGMGKTLQALSILALLFHQKPDARVLIVAPRRVVAENWISEYRTFIAQHYKREENPYNVVCAEPGGDPIHPPVHCRNLYDLRETYAKCWPHVFIIRTSNFSALVHEQSKSAHRCAADDNQCIAFEEAKSIREGIYAAATSSCTGGETPPFDLLIVDEAHYFRTKDGGSQKVAAAQAFFGSDSLENDTSRFTNDGQKEGRPIASKTLLLTATPNHSRETDIEYIFSYFPHRIELPGAKETGVGERAQAILRAVGLRRFRRFEEKTKYQYREEVPLPASFHDPPPEDFPSEIFFALYQKKLAQSASYAKRGFLHGYLEGFEAIPGAEPTVSESTEYDVAPTGIEDENDETQADPGNSAGSTDYQRSEVDADLLEELLGKYRRHYGDQKRAPKHPKYDKLVDDVVKNTLESSDVVEKAVVFVRRIPSTKEIARRINRKYDDHFARILAYAYGLGTSDGEEAEDVLRRVENTAKGHALSAGPVVEEGDNEGDPEEEQNAEAGSGEAVPEESAVNYVELLEFQKSEVLEMFSIKKGGAERVRFQVFRELYRQIQSFRKKIVTRFSIFPVMFHPGVDYFHSPYPLSGLDVVRRKEKEVKIDYEGSAFFHRRARFSEEADTKISTLEKMWGLEQAEVSESGSSPNEEGAEDGPVSEGVETLWTMFLRLLEGRAEEFSVLREYHSLSVLQKESLARFVRQGILNASELIVVLFGLYVEAAADFDGRNLQRVQSELYRKFMSRVEEKMAEPGSRLFYVMKLSVELFQSIQTKELAVHNEEDLLERSYWRWNIFNSQSPAYGYHGSTSNESILHAFNTPFFPNVLVATSILQEGVNLHMFCNTVYHYGIAWAAGDNEQRVGRVDRFFGKAHRSIMQRDVGQVLSIYPYLEQTLDETQLANFVRKKYRAEQLIDECRLDDSSPEIQTDEGGDWQNLFLLRQHGKEKGDSRVAVSYDDNGEQGEGVRTSGAGASAKNAGRRYVDPYPAVDAERLARTWPSDKYEGGKEEVSKNLPFHQVVESLKHFAARISGDYGAHFYTSKDPRDRTICIVEPELTELSYAPSSPDRAITDGSTYSTRLQPIFFRLVYQAEVSGIDRGTVYLLTLSSPLANKETYESWDKKELENMSGKLQKKYPGVQLALNEELPFQSHFYLSTRIDMPVFFDERGFENLSELELRDVFKALLYYSDRIEYEMSEKQIKQDLQLEKDLGEARAHVEETKSYSVGKEERRRARGVEEIGDHWKLLTREIGDVYRYRVKVKKGQTPFEKILRLNHAYPFVCFDNSEKYTYVNTSFPAVDVQCRESELLERWADYVAGELEGYRYNDVKV